MNCRNCESPINQFMSFGKMPIANNFSITKNYTDYVFNLDPCYCEKCNLFQLYHQPEPRLLFHENYAFHADTSSGMMSHFYDLAKKIKKEFITKDDKVLEIGCNDGGVIEGLSAMGVSSYGMDPSKNVVDKCIEKGLKVDCDFFSVNTANKLLEKYGKFKIFVALNTFAHIPDLNSLLKGIDLILDENGIIILEDPYLLDVINKTSYDQIYDEHVFIFSLNSISNLFKKIGFKLFHAQHRETAGGTMRYFLSKKKINETKDLQHLLEIENNSNLNNVKTFEKFKNNCEKSRELLLNKLYNLKKDKKVVAGYGATSKSTTILNYCDIGPELIQYITDTTITKINKFTPITAIPIYDHNFFLKNLPDTSLLFAWNHEKEIRDKEKKYIKGGGSFFTHLIKDS